MREQWRIVRQTKSSRLKRLWVFGGGLWQPTNRYMWDGITMPMIMGGSPGTVDKTVAASADDGDRTTGGSEYPPDFGTSYTFVWAGYDPRWGHSHLFGRWIEVTYAGTVTSSYIQWYGGSVVGSPEFKIYGIDEDDPPAPTTAEEFDADPLTDAGVDWDSGFGSGYKQSPSLNPIFQELADKRIIENKAIMVQLKNDKGVTPSSNVWQVRHWDYAPTGTYAAKLHIEWELLPPRIPRPPGYGVDPMIF